MRALISLGTNTTRFLVVRDEPDGGISQVEHLQTGTRLGEGLRADGSLHPHGIERTLAAVRQYTMRAREHGASLASIATSAVRRANDRDDFARQMAGVTGVPLHVLDGLTEARASYIGATYGVPHDGLRTAVLDIGGGSTELAIGCDGELFGASSVEIGSVRVGERFPALCGASPLAEAYEAAVCARIDIDAAIAKFAELGPVDRVRCVAGTPLTIAAVAFGSHVDRVSGETLTATVLEATLDRLLRAPLAERRAMPGMLPQRADILVAGGLILAQCLRLLGVTEALLESNDLLLGYLLMQRTDSLATG